MSTPTPVPPAVAPPPDPVRGPWRRLTGGLLLLALGALGGAAGSRALFTPPTPEGKAAPADKGGEPEGTVTFDADRQAAVGLEVQTARREPFRAYAWRTGRLALHDDRVAHVCPAAEGVVREAPVRLGQAVAAGDLLAVVESREFGQAKLDVHKARIALAAERELAARTRTAMTNTEELLKLLEADTPLPEIERRTGDKPIGDYRQQLLAAYTRRKQLKAQLASQRSSGGAIPEAAVLKTEADAEAASAGYTALVEELRFQVKNQTRQAELKLRDAETAFDVSKAKLVMFGLAPEAVEKLDPIAEGATASHLPVRAPFAGTVVEKHAVRSERVGPQTQMFVVADLSVLWVQADLFEADLALVRGLKSQPVVVRSAAAGVSDRPAAVTYGGDLIDRASRTLTLTAEIENPDRALKPGLFVEVGFDTGDPAPVVQLPAAAVLRHENKPFVFVQTGDDTFRRVEVALGRGAADRVEVVSGVRPGDRVVVKGGFVLKSELLKDQMVGE